MPQKLIVDPMVRCPLLLLIGAWFVRFSPAIEFLVASFSLVLNLRAGSCAARVWSVSACAGSEPHSDSDSDSDSGFLIAIEGTSRECLCQ